MAAPSTWPMASLNLIMKAMVLKRVCGVSTWREKKNVDER